MSSHEVCAVTIWMRTEGRNVDKTSMMCLFLACTSFKIPSILSNKRSDGVPSSQHVLIILPMEVVL